MNTVIKFHYYPSADELDRYDERCNEYSQKFHYYPSAVELDRLDERCNTLNDLSNKVCIPNERKYNKISSKTNKNNNFF